MGIESDLVKKRTLSMDRSITWLIPTSAKIIRTVRRSMRAMMPMPAGKLEILRPAGLPAACPGSGSQHLDGQARCRAKEKTGARARKERSEGLRGASFSFARQRNDFVELYADGDIEMQNA